MYLPSEMPKPATPSSVTTRNGATIANSRMVRPPRLMREVSASCANGVEQHVLDENGDREIHERDQYRDQRQKDKGCFQGCGPSLPLTPRQRTGTCPHARSIRGLAEMMNQSISLKRRGIH